MVRCQAGVCNVEHPSVVSVALEVGLTIVVIVVRVEERLGSAVATACFVGDSVTDFLFFFTTWLVPQQIHHQQ